MYLAEVAGGGAASSLLLLPLKSRFGAILIGNIRLSKKRKGLGDLFMLLPLNPASSESS